MDLAPIPQPTQEQVIEQSLIACGLNPQGITIKYEDYLQGIEIVIGSIAGVTTGHFKCVRDAAGHESVAFEDPAVSAAYYEYVRELERPQVLERNYGDTCNNPQTPPI